MREKEIRELRRGIGREFCRVLNAEGPQEIIDAYGRIHAMRARLKRIDPLAENYELPVPPDDYLKETVELEFQMKEAQARANKAMSDTQFLDCMKEVNRLKKLIEQRKRPAGSGPFENITRKA